MYFEAYIFRNEQADGTKELVLGIRSRRDFTRYLAPADFIAQK